MKAVRASLSRHTDMLMISQRSPKTGMSVASPPSDCRRQTKPSAASASALTGSRWSTKSFNSGESSGNLRRAMFTWASSYAADSVMTER
jgi:hypothetical protein